MRPSERHLFWMRVRQTLKTIFLLVLLAAAVCLIPRDTPQRFKTAFEQLTGKGRGLQQMMRDLRGQEKIDNAEKILKDSRR